MRATSCIACAGPPIFARASNLSKHVGFRVKTLDENRERRGAASDVEDAVPRKDSGRLDETSLDPVFSHEPTTLQQIVEGEQPIVSGRGYEAPSADCP